MFNTSAHFAAIFTCLKIRKSVTGPLYAFMFGANVRRCIIGPEQLYFDLVCLSADDVISMADSTITVEDIEGELFRIERIRDILVRRESELRYM